jgi:phage tail sheath protein FI
MRAIRSCALSKDAELRNDEALLEERIGVASSLRLERELESAGSRAVDVEGSVDIAEGTKHAVDASADAQEVIASLDSRLRLAEVVDTTADRLGFDDEEREALREETVEVIRELLELGALRFRGD